MSVSAHEPLWMMAAGQAQEQSRRRRWRMPFPVVAAAILAICVVWLWVMPLSSSFWVDEMGTRFVVRYGGDHPSFRVAPQVPASNYYSLPWLIQESVGFSEAAYRVPSLLAMAAALWLIARLAQRLIHPAAGWFAAFACLALRGFNYQAADARPYALGTLVASGAFWLLVRWLERDRLIDAMSFLACAALLWRVHLIFWPMYVAMALFTAIQIWRVETSVSWKKAGVAFTVLGMTLLPVALSARSLLHEAGAHVVTALPTFDKLQGSLKMGFVLGTVAAAALVGRFVWRRRGARPEALALTLCWWLVQPLALFAFSWITGNSVYLPRYLFVALPGTALMVTLGVSWFLPAQYWKGASVALGVGVLLFVAPWKTGWPRHHNSDWRMAAARVNALPAADTVPVICPSPFVEARPPVWKPSYATPSFLYSHLEVYPVRGRKFPFPFEMSREAEAHATALVTERLREDRRFVIYGGNQIVGVWQKWFRARPELADWRSRRLGPFGDVEVVVFERMSPRTLHASLD